MRVRRSIPRFAILLLYLLAGFPVFDVTAQAGGPIYFEETQHTLEGAFLEYFEQHGGVEVFGYPISEPFLDGGVRVQYFQKARMEEHPLNPEPYVVQLGLLGDQLNYRQPSVNRPNFPSRRRHYFPETGHVVSYAFLDYFKQHGSVDVFGFPITEMHFEDGRIVQYFQRLKLEWHPEDTLSPVHVGNLGEVYVNAYRERLPVAAFEPVSQMARPDPAPVSAVTSLRVVVSVRFSVLLVGREESQIVSVLVTDNGGEPVENAQVLIQLQEDTGRALNTVTTLTDSRGFARVAVPVTGAQTGEQVVVKANVSFSGLQATAESVFLIW